MNGPLQAEAQALADSVRRFTLERIAPRVAEWEAAGELPRSLHAEAATLGETCLASPDHAGARLCGSGAWLGGTDWRGAGRVDDFRMNKLRPAIAPSPASARQD